MSTAVFEWLGHLGLAGIQVLAWWGLGSLLLRRLRTGERAVDVLNAIGCGAVAFALLTFAAGLAGLLYPALIAVVTGAAAVAGAIGVIRAKPPRLRVRGRSRVAAVLLLGVTTVLALVAAGAPVNSFDGLAYHVSVPALYEQEHRIFEVAWSWHSYQPFTVEMLMLDGMLLWDPVQGAYAPLALVLLATAAVGVGGRLVGGDGLGLLAAALFLVQPLVAWEATASLVDGGVAAAVALAALNLLVWARTRRSTTLVLAGVFLGAAAGMKYIGLFAALAVGVAVLLAARGRTRLVVVGLLALPAVLVALPWYVRNTVLTGNPLFPFLFGGVGDSARASVDAQTRGYGFGRSPVDAILLPKRLLTEGESFDGANWLSPLMLVLPLLALRDRSLRRGTAAALAGVAVYLAIWFATSQQARFLIPILPVLALLAALGLRELLRVSWRGRLVAAVAAVGTFAAGLATFAVFCAQFFPVVFGFESTEHFLSRRTAYYDGVTWLNREVGDGARVLTDFASPYLEPDYVVWTPFALPPEAGPAETRRFARSEGLRYAAVLAVNEPGRRTQLRALGARPLATVDVHTAFLGLRNWGGFPHRLLVYRLSAPD